MDSSEGEGEMSPDSTQAWKIDSRTPSPQQASRSRSRSLSRSRSRSLEPTQAWKVGSRTPSPQPGSRSRSRSPEPTQAWNIHSSTPSPQPGSRSRSRSLESTQVWKIDPRTQSPHQQIASRSRSRSLSRSRSRSLSKSRSKSLSRSRSVSRSKSRQMSRSMSCSRSKSESPARSGARSPRSRSSSASISRSRFGRLRTSRSASLSVSPTPEPQSSSSRKKMPESSSSRKRIRQNRSSSSRSVSPQRLRDSGGSGDEGAVKKSVTTSLGLDVSSDEEDVVEDGRADIFKRREAREGPEEDSDDDIVRRDDSPLRDGGGGNDFEMMMTRKRQENKRRQKKKDIDVINENDDAIAKLIADMRIAAKEDRDLNNAGQPATKKMAMFQRVMCNLKKGELRMAFVEANLLSVMTDWLAPMPDKGLPHVHMRTAFLKLLQELRIEEPSRLKESGIGKAVMYLYRHPRETRENKVTAGHIINAWARPIFRKEDNFAHMSREDRRERDDAIARRRGGKKVKKQEEEKEALKPGDPGWVNRARVPMPDAQEYIKRPEWQNDAVIGTIKKKKVSLLEKHKRKFAERRRAYRTVSMTKISIEGARMNLGSDGMNVIH